MKYSYDNKGGERMDTTNYSKVAMEELSSNIATKKEEFNSLIESLSASISNMHNYWVEGDTNAEAVYTSLLEQFNQFKADLNEGYELMSQYEARVNDQIERYKQAEQQALNSING